MMRSIWLLQALKEPRGKRNPRNKVRSEANRTATKGPVEQRSNTTTESKQVRLGNVSVKLGLVSAPQDPPRPLL